MCGNLTNAQQNSSGFNGQSLLNPYFNSSTVDCDDFGLFDFLDNTYTNDFLVSYGEPGYLGEFQISLKLHPWKQNNFKVTYTMENVSFPFVPNCFETGCAGFSNRELNIINDNLFPFDGGIWGNTLYNWVDGNISSATGFSDQLSGMNEGRFIASKYFHDNLPAGPNLFRKELPHSVIRIKLFAFCSSQSNPMDSLVYYVDLTRGRMKFYPFINVNGQSESTKKFYDVVLTPILYEKPASIEINPNGATMNYFGNLGCGQSPCSVYEARKPKDYSLQQIYVGNALGDCFAGYDDDGIAIPGIEHEYVVNRPFDLTVINPIEKVIYNPSEVLFHLPVNETFIFPSGYTFRTVYATYPTAADYAALPQATLYNNPLQAILPNNANTGNLRSEYVVDQGILEIEPCVTLVDLDIVVKSGGKVRIPQNGVNLINATITLDNANPGIIETYSNSTSCSFYALNPNEYHINSSFIINSNITWSDNNLPQQNQIPSATNELRVNGEILVNSGSLTIEEGVHLKFGPKGKIIVQPGASLVLSGTTTNPVVLEGLFGTTWHGIELIGSSTYNNAANYALNTNKSFIKDARIGVQTVIDNELHAAKFVIQQSTFENCHIGLYIKRNAFANPIETSPYTLASVYNSNFITTKKLDQLPFYDDCFPAQSITHILLENTRIIGLNNLTFDNQVATLYAPPARGTGIKCIDSQLMLQSPCTFKNLADGIWSESTMNKINPLKVTGSTFTDNVRGIVGINSRYANLNRNTFTVPESPRMGVSPPALASGYDKPVGIFMVESKYYDINQNTILQTATTETANPNFFSYGIVINNTVTPNALEGAQTGNGRLYKNSIEGTSIGLQAELDNSGQYPYEPYLNTNSIGTGLGVFCSNFISNGNYNWTVAGISGNLGTSIPGLIRDQGFCRFELGKQYLPGNNFMPCYHSINQNQQLNLLAQGQGFTYTEKDITINTTAFGCFANQITKNECNLFSNDCPSEFAAPCPVLPCKLEDFQEKWGRYSDFKADLMALFNSGQAEAFTPALVANSPSGCISMLESAQPYITSDAWLATLARCEDLDHAKLYQVLSNSAPFVADVAQAIQQSACFTDAEKQTLAALQQTQGAALNAIKELNTLAWTAEQQRTALIMAALEADSLSHVWNALQIGTNASRVYDDLALALFANDMQTAQDLLEWAELENLGNAAQYEWAAKSVQQVTDTLRLNQLSISQQLVDNLQQDTARQWITKAFLANTQKAAFLLRPLDVQADTSQTTPPSGSTTSQATLLAYPNPFTNTVTIELGNLPTTAHVTLNYINAQGTVVSMQQLGTLRSTTWQAPIAGLYAVIVWVDGMFYGSSILIAQ